ncbi:MAG: hypothetical protein WBV93_06900 [Anaerobacillus sp.]
MKKSSYWKDTFECYLWIGMIVLPFWATIVISAELSGQHLVDILLSYVK